MVDYTPQSEAAAAVKTAPSVLTTLLRYGLTTVGGWLIGKGYITGEQSLQLVGIAGPLAGAVWGVYSTVKSKQALKAAIDAPKGKAS